VKKVADVDLDEYLRKSGVWHRFINKPETIHTSDAAKAAGVDLRRLTKNLVSQTDQGENVLLIVSGDRKVDLKAAARVLSVRNVRLVAFDQAEKISGYSPGGTPSVGHKTKMRVVVDESLLQYDTVYCGGGTRDRLLQLRIEDIIGLNGAIVAGISDTS